MAPNFRYRLQHRTGPRDDLDRTYSSLPAAKSQLTIQARRYRIFSYVILDQETGERFAYDQNQHKVVPIGPAVPLDS